MLRAAKTNAFAGYYAFTGQSRFLGFPCPLILPMRVMISVSMRSLKRQMLDYEDLRKRYNLGGESDPVRWAHSFPIQKLFFIADVKTPVDEPNEFEREILENYVTLVQIERVEPIHPPAPDHYVTVMPLPYTIQFGKGLNNSTIKPDEVTVLLDLCLRLERGQKLFNPLTEEQVESHAAWKILANRKYREARRGCIVWRRHHGWRVPENWREVFQQRFAYANLERIEA